jgi:hypothetical protein
MTAVTVGTEGLTIDKTPPTCSGCDHSWKQINGGSWMCSRGLTSFHRIEGERAISRTCDYERSRFWRWLGAETCGREGRYWAKRIERSPPTRGSCVSKPARPSR